MKVLDLFSGIGGFSLGLERAGFETVAFCEIEPYCQKVLKKHWPNIPIYEDVRNVTRERLEADGIIPDVITGGFPCQDISVAGKQAGIEGERSGLWSECARILGEFRPRYAIFENVTALLSGERGKWFERVLWDISEVGYDAEWHCIPASSVGANHRRDRVWIITYPNNAKQSSGSWQGRGGELSKPGNYSSRRVVANAASNRLERDMRKTTAQVLHNWASQALGSQHWRSGAFTNWQKLMDKPEFCRMDDGVSSTMDIRPRLHAYGNAVVPQIPQIIGRAILEHERWKL